MINLLKKEILGFLSSLTGYIVIIVFLSINGIFLWILPDGYNVLDYGYAGLDGLFYISPYVFLFLIPAVTMRLFAEEQRSGTIEILVTKPISNFKIILAKYLAGLLLVLFSLLPTLLYVFSVYQLGYPTGNLDLGSIWGSYIGLFFLGASFVAIGLFASSVSDNPVISFIIAILLSSFVYDGFELIYSLSLFSNIDLFIQNLGIRAHYISVSRGVIDSRDIIYFLSLIFLFITLIQVVFDKKEAKWLVKKSKGITSFRMDDRRIRKMFVALLIILITNFISSSIYKRWDLTAEKRYTLTDASKSILDKIDTELYFKVYLDGDFPAGFKRLRNESRGMLYQFRAYNKNINFRFINPSAETDNEKRNQLYERLAASGLNQTDLQVRTTEGLRQQLIFPGALVSYKDKELPVDFLNSQMGVPPEAVLNNSIQSLEFNIANVINKLSRSTNLRIGFLNGHGELAPIYVADIAQTLAQDYVIEGVEINGDQNSLIEFVTADSIQNKYSALIIAKPESVFSRQDKFVIDQFIMRGGKILWLLDPVLASMDSLKRVRSTMAITKYLNLDDQLFTYGVRLNNNLIMDLNALPIPLRTGQMGNQAQIEFFPWYFYPIISPAGNHPIVKNLNAIKTEFVSSIDTIAKAGIKKTILLTSSNNSRVINTPAIISLDILQSEPDVRFFNQPGQPIAVLLEGEFESVFKNRLSPFSQNISSSGIIYKSITTQMIVVTDGDIIKNQLHNTRHDPLPLGYDQYTQQTFGNKDFILNAINYLTDGRELISIRNREIKLRLLDKAEITSNRLFWQLFNVVLPILLVLIFGIVQSLIRKKKYTGRYI